MRHLAFVRPLGMAATALLLVGCASLQAKQKPVADLVTATSALTAAEAKMYDEIQGASNQRRELQIQAAFVSDTDWKLVAKELDTKAPSYAVAKAARMQALKQLNNYAVAVQEIQTTGSAGWPAAEASSTIADTQKLATDLGAGLTANEKADIQTATSVVNSLGTAIVQSQAAKEIETLAQREDVKQGLAALQTMIDEDGRVINDQFIPAVIDAQRLAQRQMLQAIFAKSSDPIERYNAYHAVESIEIVLVDQQRAISEAMTKIRAANDALATQDRLTAIDLSNQATAAANAALVAGKSN